MADVLQRGRVGVEAEPQLEDPALPLGQRRDRPANVEPPERVRRLRRLNCNRARVDDPY
jgi:hypothetical protein